MIATLGLNPREHAALLEEVAAMMAAQRPLVPGLRTLEDQHLGRIGRAASLLRAQLEQGSSVEDALQSLDSRTGPQLAAALRMAVIRGDAEPLYRLAALLRRRRELAVATRVAMLYPIMLLVLGYAVLVLVFAPLVTQDQTAVVLWPAGVVAVGRWLIAFWYLPPLLAVLLGVLVWRVTRDTRWSPQTLLPGRFGRLALFCQTVAMQIDVEVPQPSAMRAAAEIGGDRRLRLAAESLAERLERGEADTMESGAVTGSRRAFAPLPPMLVWLLRHGGQLGGEIVAAQLRGLSQWYEQRERVQRQRWMRWGPAVLAAVGGGAFVLVYLFMALLPMYNRLAGIE